MSAHTPPPFPPPIPGPDPFPNLTKKHAGVTPPVKHPAFLPTEMPDSVQAAWAEENRYFIRLVTEALRQAWELTPWNVAVRLLVLRADFQAISNAVAIVAGPTLGKRVYLVPVPSNPDGKRVMIDPKGATQYLKGTPPWGEEPAADVGGEPPLAQIGAAPQPGDAELDPPADPGEVPPAEETAAGARLDASE